MTDKEIILKELREKLEYDVNSKLYRAIENALENQEKYKKSIPMLTDREREVLSSNLSAEIMKMQFHYGNRVPERLQVLYSLRDKLCHDKEDKK